MTPMKNILKSGSLPSHPNTSNLIGARRPLYLRRNRPQLAMGAKLPLWSRRLASARRRAPPPSLMGDAVLCAAPRGTILTIFKSSLLDLKKQAPPAKSGRRVVLRVDLPVRPSSTSSKRRPASARPSAGTAWATRPCAPRRRWQKCRPVCAFCDGSMPILPRAGHIHTILTRV